MSCSQLACALASTNLTCRYFQSLAMEGLLPRVLSRRNRHHSPSAALWVLGAVQLIVILGCAFVGVDPYLEVSPIGFGLAALGATSLQCLCSIAVVRYFLRLPKSERSFWSTFVAPVLAAVLLAAAFVVEIHAFTYITGSDEPYMSYVPWIVPAVAVFGLYFGYWLRRNRPDHYAILSGGDTTEEAAEIHQRLVAMRGRSSVSPGVHEATTVSDPAKTSGVEHDAVRLGSEDAS
ncbi:amino acid permease [Streptomyces sp. NPDC052052]|uniref:amino acid permease n=1 Tax=Streptomyces sp. NPDC052052 TaxID=3154756 RepID=UPI003435D070